MQKGDRVYTPRFLTVTIQDVLSRKQAAEQGYKEPTHYYDPSGEYDVYGHVYKPNHMKFAAVRKGHI